MHEEESTSRVVPVDHDLSDFQQRAARHNPSPERTGTTEPGNDARFLHALRLGSYPFGRYPHRYAFHVLLVLFVPLALVANQPTAPLPVKAEALGRSADLSLQLSHAERRPLIMATSDSAERTALSNTWDAAGASLSQDAVGAALPGPLMLSAATTRSDVLLPPPAEQPASAAPAPIEPSTPTEQPPSNHPVTDEPQVFTAQVTADKANLRGGPGTAYDKVGTVQLDDTLTVLAKHEDWREIRTADGQVAWISGDLLDLPEELLAGIPQAENIPEPPPPLVAEVAQDNLNLRDGPDTEYVGMTKLPAGTQLDLLARYGSWYRVQTADGAVGWVTGEYLAMRAGVAERVPETASIPPANPNLAGTTIESDLNLRQGPGTEYPSLGRMDAGVELKLLARYKNWYKVETPRGTVGWTLGDFVEVSAFINRRVPETSDIPALAKPEPKPAAKPKPKPKSGGAAPQPAVGASGDVAGLAWRYVGYRYVWGGESPGVGFDCSGLTKYVYSLVGVSLPHNAAAQFSSRYGAVIRNMGSLAPGDLVFFVNTAGPGISHVGIYVGGGKVVHATTPRTGVIVSNIYERYWTRHFYGAVRPYR